MTPGWFEELKNPWEPQYAGFLAAIDRSNPNNQGRRKEDKR